MSTCPLADRPSRRNRHSADECCRSGPSSASGSRKTVTASSNETPCFAALASAFRGIPLEHAFSIYEMRGPAGTVLHRRHQCHRAVRSQLRSVFVSELCQIPRDTPVKHRDLQGHSDAHRCCRKSLMEGALVRVGMRQHARPESISKRAPSTTRTSLRLESTICEWSAIRVSHNACRIPLPRDEVWIQQLTGGGNNDIAETVSDLPMFSDH